MYNVLVYMFHIWSRTQGLHLVARLADTFGIRCWFGAFWSSGSADQALAALDQRGLLSGSQNLHITLSSAAETTFLHGDWREKNTQLIPLYHGSPPFAEEI